MAVSPRNVFRPALDAALEPRLLLSSARPRAAAEVQAPATTRPIPPLQRVGLAFDSFRADLDRSRTAAFAVLGRRVPVDPAVPGMPTLAETMALVAERTSALRAFRGLVEQRTNELAQDVVRAVQGPLLAGAGKKGQGQAQAGVSGLVARRINGQAPTTPGPVTPNTPFAPVRGTLLKALLDVLPTANELPLSPESADLIADAQDDAIDAAQASVLNGLNLSRQRRGKSR